MPWSVSSSATTRLEASALFGDRVAANDKIPPAIGDAADNLLDALPGDAASYSVVAAGEDARITLTVAFEPAAMRGEGDAA
jgi:hypothetical protein